MIHLKISEENLALMERTVRDTAELLKETKTIETKYEYEEMLKICGRINLIWLELCNNRRYVETARKAYDLITKLWFLLDSTDFDKLEVWK